MDNMDQVKLASKFFEVFSSESGKDILDYFNSITQSSSLSYNWLMDIGCDLPARDCALVREGQNQVVVSALV